MIALLMIVVELKLVHLIGMKNAGGCSACNPTERPIGSTTLGLQTLELDRCESSLEM